MIPINTDAPIYHFPVMTITLIVVNVLAFFLTAGGNPEEVERWAQWSLQHGQGLQPIQWITSNFVHGGFWHLIGNMIFLWAFGLVVEGKLGWWRYLLVFLGIGILQCALEQTIMLRHDAVESYVEYQMQVLEAQTALMSEEEITELEASGFDLQMYRQDLKLEAENDLPQMPGSFGASAIIYGILAIALVWAPANDMQVVYMLPAVGGYRIYLSDISILVFVGINIGFQFLIATMQNFTIATATLHLMGAMVGFPVGVALLKLGVVDGEDWDLFSVMSGHYGPYARDKYGNRITIEEKREEDRRRKEERKRFMAEPTYESEPTDDEGLSEIEALIADGFYEDASNELWALRVQRDFDLDQDNLQRLISGLLKQECWEDAAVLMEECVERFDDNSSIRLHLARVQLTRTGEWQSAVRNLKAIDRESLNEKQMKLFRNLAEEAKRRRK